MRAQKRRVLQPTPTELRAYPLPDGSLRFYASADGGAPEQLMGRDLRDPGDNAAIMQINERIFADQLRVLFGPRGRRVLVINEEERALLELYIGVGLLEARLIERDGLKVVLPTEDEKRVSTTQRDDRLLGVPSGPPIMFASSGQADA